MTGPTSSVAARGGLLFAGGLLTPLAAFALMVVMLSVLVSALTLTLGRGSGAPAQAQERENEQETLRQAA